MYEYSVSGASPIVELLELPTYHASVVLLPLKRTHPVELFALVELDVYVLAVIDVPPL